MKFIALGLGAALAAFAFAASASAHAVVGVSVRFPAPPPPPHVVVHPGIAWVPGYWRWNGVRNVWIGGYRLGPRYVPVHWVRGRPVSRPYLVYVHH